MYAAKDGELNGLYMWYVNAQGMVAQYGQHPEYGAYAQRLMTGELWQRPRGGGHDDKAHPPIHPTRCTTGEQDWTQDKKRLYDFVVRHFLACCSKPAQGYETKVTAMMGDEAFIATGTHGGCYK